MCHFGLDVLPVHSSSLSNLSFGWRTVAIRMTLYSWSSWSVASVPCSSLSLPSPFSWPFWSSLPHPSVPAVLSSIVPLVALLEIASSLQALYLVLLLVASFSFHLSEASDNRNTSTLDYESVHHQSSLQSPNNSISGLTPSRMSSANRSALVPNSTVLNQAGLNGSDWADRLWPYHNNMNPFDTHPDESSLTNSSAQSDSRMSWLVSTEPMPTVTQANVYANLTELVTNLNALMSHNGPGSSTIGPNLSSNEMPLSTVFYTSAYEENASSMAGSTIVLEPDLRIHHPILALLLGMICVIVVFGNVLTMLSIYKERYLHTVTNYFVASLAAADCLVGAIVMPFSVVHEVMNKWWIFGQDWCDLWHSFDVLASSASILNLCVISLDRYWAITDPITYPSRMTPSKASLFIFGLWFCSALISFPAIVWWRAVQKEPVAPFRCLFTDDVGYLVFSSTISFYGPLTIMVFTYYRIYVIASKQTRSLKLGVKQIEMSSITDGGSSSGDYHTGGFTLRMHRGGYQISNSHPPNKHNTLNYHSVSHDALSLSKSESYDIKASVEQLPPVGHAEYADYETNGDRSHLDSTSQATRNMRNHKANWSVGRRLAKLAKERKAAKTLGIVMGVFILCWLPFFVTNILMGICPETCILEPDLVFSVVTWLGWINSAMNPIIYACWSKDFRRAFRKLLCSCFISSSNLSYNRNRIYKAPHNRYNYYYKSKVKRDTNNADHFNFDSETNCKQTQSAKLSNNSNCLVAKLKANLQQQQQAEETNNNNNNNNNNQCRSDSSKNANGSPHPSQLTSPVEQSNNANSNANCDTMANNNSSNNKNNELPLANNILHIHVLNSKHSKNAIK